MADGLDNLTQARIEQRLSEAAVALARKRAHSERAAELGRELANQLDGGSSDDWAEAKQVIAPVVRAADDSHVLAENAVRAAAAEIRRVLALDRYDGLRIAVARLRKRHAIAATFVITPEDSIELPPETPEQPAIDPRWVRLDESPSSLLAPRELVACDDDALPDGAIRPLLDRLVPARVWCDRSGAVGPLGDSPEEVLVRYGDRLFSPIAHMLADAGALRPPLAALGSDAVWTALLALSHRALSDPPALAITGAAWRSGWKHSTRPIPGLDELRAGFADSPYGPP
jgi:hypothetical protein